MLPGCCCGVLHCGAEGLLLLLLQRCCRNGAAVVLLRWLCCRGAVLTWNSRDEKKMDTKGICEEGRGGRLLVNAGQECILVKSL